MKLNWSFLEGVGVQNKKPSVGGLWIFSGTAQFIENNTWARGDMEFIFECSHRHRTSERSERVRY